MLLVLTPRPAGNGLPMIVYRTAQFFVAWAFISVPVSIVAEVLWKHPTVCDLLPFRNPLLPFLIALFLLLTATRAVRSLPAASVWPSSGHTPRHLPAPNGACFPGAEIPIIGMSARPD
jgi:hypothetical protein